MRIIDIWFDGDYICGRDDDGGVHRQSLLWYPRLRAAGTEDRLKHTFGYDGIHWRHLDEDISFESFLYEDAEPSAIQRFFLTHPEINLSQFAKSIGIGLSMLRNFINGMKKPSEEYERSILRHINHLGFEL